MLNQHNLVRPQQLLADDNRPEGIDSRGTGLIIPIWLAHVPHGTPRHHTLDAGSVRKGVREGWEKTHIPNNMRIAQLDAKRLCGIDTRVHACEDEVLFRRGQGEVALGEGGGELGRGGLDVCLDGAHGCWLVDCWVR